MEVSRWARSQKIFFGTSGLSFGPLPWIRHCYCYFERDTSILVLLQAFMKKGIMIRWTNLETWPNRDVFIFWIHDSAFVIRRAIDVLQSMNPKSRWRILQITSYVILFTVKTLKLTVTSVSLLELVRRWTQHFTKIDQEKRKIEQET